MTSCIVGKKIGAVGSGHLELFPFVVLAICVLSLMAMAWSICEHMLTSWSSFLISLEKHTLWVLIRSALMMSTIITLSIQTPQLLTLLFLKFEQVQYTTRCCV